MLLDRPPEERLRMGFSMYDTAKEIVKSAIRQKFPGITPEDLKKEIFLRFYGFEFDAREKEKIIAALMRS
jgi:hypothetical protein